MRDILGNHVAIVEKGRAGREVRVDVGDNKQTENSWGGNRRGETTANEVARMQERKLR